MKSLVISNSKILLQFFELVLDKRAEYVDKAKNAKSKRYNLVFIDDILDVKKEIDYIKKHLKYNYLILVGNDKKYRDFVDLVLKKPFLPRDIEDLVERLKDNKRILKLEDVISDLELYEEEMETIKTNILDPDEVAKIKELIPKDESQIFSIINGKKKAKLKNKKAKKLLEEICKLSKKEKKKLLKDAKVVIKIKFKDNK
jgi:hypothetical protein